jgi:hypothetical protein
MKIDRTALFAAVFLLLAGASLAMAGEIKYNPVKVDLFGIKMQVPEGWEKQVTADNVTFTCPADKLVQLVFVDGGKTSASLDEFHRDYRDEKTNPLLSEFKLKLIDSRPVDVAGIGGYYLRFKSAQKDFGHVIFIHREHQYAIALKTPLGQYGKFEPVLKEAMKTLSFYSPPAK